MRTARLVQLLLLASLGACVQTQVTMLGSKTYAPVVATDVRVFTSEDEIEGRYERVALIHAQGESSWTNEAQMIEAARRKAASIGANGIVLGEVKEPSAGAQVAAAVFGVGATRRGQILAVRLAETDESEAGQNVAPGSTRNPEAQALAPLSSLPVVMLD
jgi:hypothetical protein